MRDIKNVFVNWISLVTKNETPAVEQAWISFALFKTKERKKMNELRKIKLNLCKKLLEDIKNNLA
jgi:hypothetical protein